MSDFHFGILSIIYGSIGFFFGYAIASISNVKFTALTWQLITFWGFLNLPMFVIYLIAFTFDMMPFRGTVHLLLTALLLSTALANLARICRKKMT